MSSKSRQKWKMLSLSQLSPTPKQPPSSHHPRKIRFPVILINSFIATLLLHSFVPGTTADSVLDNVDTDLFTHHSNMLLQTLNASNAEDFDKIIDIDETPGPNATSVPNPYANWSVEELMELEIDDNPLRDPLSIAIPMTVIYSLILLSGLVGNVSTCVVIASRTYMHTATNYYLFSLAMSDLLLLISGLPQEIYHIWIKYPYIFGEAFCVIRGLAAETSANATVLTITAFTVERFVAIVYPLKSHKLSQLSRVVRMIGIIWVVAFCLALPQAAQFGVKDHMSTHSPNVILIPGAWCTLVREIFPYAFQISICVFFVIPMTLISVLYILIGLKLRRSRKGPLNPEPRLHSRHSQSHVVRMLIAVVIAFGFCWLPFHCQRLMALYGSSSQKTPSPFFMMVYQGLTHVSGILYYLSTCVNPILYHIMSNKFRQAFKDTLASLCGNHPPSHRGHHSRTYSAMSYSHRNSRMTHYTSTRNNNTNILLLPGKNSPLPIKDKAGETVEPEVSVATGNGSLLHEPSCPCSCPPVGNGVGRTPKIATTILSSKTVFVTKTHCPECGGYPNGRGVTFGFLGKVKNGSNGVYRNGLDKSTSADKMSSRSVSSLETNGIPMTELTPKSNGKSHLPHPLRSDKPKPSLKAFLRRKKDKSDPCSGSLGLSASSYSPKTYSVTPPPTRVSSAVAVTILDAKGSSKTLVHHRERMGSSGNVVIIPNPTCRATSYTSMDSGSAMSANTNTISNSSLQSDIEGEYTSEELAGVMAELNHNLDYPKTVLI